MISEQCRRLFNIDKDDDVNILNKEYETDAHTIKLEDLLSKFQTNLETGLSNEVAKRHLQENSPNKIVFRKNVMLSVTITNYILTAYNFLLFSTSFLCFFNYFVSVNAKDGTKPHEFVLIGTLMLIIILASSIFSLYENMRYASMVNAFKNLIPSTARVLRDGTVTTISSEHLVTGDIIVLEAGDIISADVRILDSDNFTIEMYNITGNTIPTHRSANCTDPDPLLTENLAFLSCKVVKGKASCLVIAIGLDTYVGKLANLTSSIKLPNTPIQNDIFKFTRAVTYSTVILGSVLSIISLITEANSYEAMLPIMGLYLGSIPEGLTVAILGYMSYKKIDRSIYKNFIAKRPQILEALGASSILCIDKTNVLTKNNMSVTHLYFQGKLVNSNDTMARTGIAYRVLARAACCSINIVNKKDIPNPIDIGIHEYFEKCYHYTTIIKENKKIGDIPGNYYINCQASIHIQSIDLKYVLLIKGKIENILIKCTTILLTNKEIELSTEMKDTIIKICNNLKTYGKKIVAYCHHILSSTDFIQSNDGMSLPVQGFRFVGFLATAEPVCAFAQSAIINLQRAGVKVVMLTNDDPQTALATAKKLNIIKQSNTTLYETNKDLMSMTDYFNIQSHMKAGFFTGQDLKAVDQNLIDKVLLNVEEIALSNLSTYQKLMIVERYQRYGHVVTYIGNGVTDAAALRKSNVGIAMKLYASSTALDLSDMVIYTDKLLHIILAIEEGRLLLKNLRRFMFFTTSLNMPKMMPFIVYIILGLPLPIHGMSIIILGWFFNIIPTISLAIKKSKSDVMKELPASSHLNTDEIFFISYAHFGVLQTFAGLFSYFVTMARHGFMPRVLFFSKSEWYCQTCDNFKDSYGQERTYADRQFAEIASQSTYFLSVVIIHLIFFMLHGRRELSFTCRPYCSAYMFAALSASITLTMIVIYSPLISVYFHIKPISLENILVILPFLIVFIIFIEIRKHIIRKYPEWPYSRKLDY